MKSTVLKKDQTNNKAIKPFKVKQALAAIELGSTDAAIFNYMQFFLKKIPADKASFIHVIPDTSLLTSLYHKAGETNFSKYTLIDQLANELGEKIKYHFEEDAKTKYHAILEGNPLGKLLETGKEINSDLLFIGQDGENKYHSILAKNLVRNSKGNSMIIPDSAQATLNHILVPIDFSVNSKKALETAISINRRLEKPATITCLHVYEMPNLSRLKISRSQDDFEGMIRSDKKDAMEFFLSTIDPADRSYIETQLLLKESPGTAKFIMKAAAENNNDLIVMGAKGYSQVDLLLMGSVTEKLMNMNKTVATLIVK